MIRNDTKIFGFDTNSQQTVMGCYFSLCTSLCDVDQIGLFDFA